MAEDMGSSDRPVRITYKGEAGRLQASVATPLAVVLNELLQNAAEHARPAAEDHVAEPSELSVYVELSRDDGELRVVVRDDGVGLPPGFSIAATSTLGLSIVRDLVGTQLGGTISMRTDGGTVVELAIPVDHVTEDLTRL
jgi:two-component sensor histidine kinase